MNRSPKPLNRMTPDSRSERMLYLHAQESTSRILAHGASDAQELQELARLASLPVRVLRLQEDTSY